MHYTAIQRTRISESRAVHHQHLQRQNAQDSTRSDSSSKRSFADALSPITNPSLSFASTLQSSSAQKSRGPYSSNEPTSPPYNISSAQGRDPLAQSISSVPLSSPSLEPNPQYGALGSIHPHSSSNLSQKANSPLPGIQGSDQYSEASMASNAGRNYDPTRASMRTQQRHRQRLAELRSPDPMTSSMLSSTSTLHSEDNSMTVIPITGRESGQAETQTQGMHRQPVTLPLLGRQYDETRSHPQAPPYPIYQHNLGKISPTTSTPPATSSSLPPQIATGAPGLNSTIARPQPMGSAVSQISSVGTSRGESKEESSASGIVEYLRNDFVAAADEWFNYVTNEAKGFPDSTVHHSIRKFQFSLDCDGSARKIVQVIYSRLKDLLKGEKVVICRGSPTTESNTKRRLQTLLSITSLTDPIDKDFGRIVNISKEDDTELVLVAYNEQQTLDTLRRGQEPSVPMPTSLIKLADSEQDTYSKFLPNLKPFIPRQRLIYLIMRGEGSTCYLYNYTNDVVSKTKEIVERAILWHNARSRLLREIGLHKMGITHLSTLKSADAKFNSYLLLTWMDPETLVRNDYPVDNLETPDFSKIPRLYAQMLLKLYRFSDPAFVAKNLNPSPFEDQTQQMLTLREDVRAMLNDHREFQEIHKKLISGDSTFAEDIFNRILRRSHQDHFVQSPILLFPNWRRKVGAIRTGADWSLVGCRKHSYPSLNVHSTVRSSPKIRSKTITSSCPEKPGKVENEPCLLRIQQLLIEDYVKHLKCIKFEDSLSLNVIKLEQIPEPVHSKTSSGGNGAVSCTSPNVWLYLALPGGIIFMELCFVDPYFCVRILQWNNSLLEECLYPNSKPSFEQRDRLRHLDRVKNELMQKSHVHSFTYDFHLRIVAKYLTGGTQVLFNPGYNTNAFLTDFLQYYGCRPSFARNCIYEENIQCTHLQVSHSNIWEFFLDNEQQFGWNVVRLKTLDQSNSADEFMLVSKEEQKMLQNQFYTFVTMILNNAKSSTLKDHQISIKFYVILIAEEEVSPTITDASPLEAVDSTDAGEFRRVAGAPNISPQSTMLGGAGGDLLTPFEESDTGEIEDDESTPVAHAGIPNADDIVNRNYGISVPYRTNFYPERERAEPNTITDILGIDSNRRRFCSGGNVNTGRHTSAPTRNFGSNGRDGRRNYVFGLLFPNLRSVEYIVVPFCHRKWHITSNPASPQSGKRGTICHEHECDENSPSSEHKRLSILRAPPRRHRHPGSIDQNANDMGVLVPPEQVTYLHYLSSHQRRLQQLLEESVKIKNGEITRFVLDADKLTYRNKLWKSLLSSKSSHIRRQQTLSFIPPSTSKMDVLADSSQKLMSSSEMEPDDFDSLLRIIRMERMVDEEPRIAQILAGVNFQDLTRFLIQYYEGEKRCRYFENGPRAYLIIMNPSFLDSATMFSNCPKNGIEMFFLFKNTDRSFGKVEQEPFSANSIHKMFEDVVSCLCAFTWSNMLHNPPTLP
ncbi:KICSTOR complex protein SZT2 [Ditylenchus destructor]|uniref:KICSTOR complex protein SZT2 n=1 Tax=Ditylenchus destructor TaxID=166010 RepID=A0AAD4R608_9BILA|nr:KICSTOR complex protein SZT2 [Ditylenchus destructor]